LNATKWWTTYSIGNLMFGHVLKLHGGYVTINGNVNVSDSNFHHRYDSKLIANTEELTMTGNSTLQSSFFFAHTKGPIRIEKGFNMTSITRQTCSAPHHIPKMFSCVPPRSLETDITYNSFMDHFNRRFKKDIKIIDHTISTLAQGYLVYFMSESLIDI
jgi:hypothetical protein